MEAYQHKRRKLVEKKTAGVQLNDFLDLQRWAEAHELPAKREDMAPFEVYSVPAAKRFFSSGKSAQVSLSSLIFVFLIFVTRPLV